MIVTVKHPATFTDVLGDEIVKLVWDAAGPERDYMLLDPFAGTGTIHDMFRGYPNIRTFGIEIEPEWARLDSATVVGDATDLPFKDRIFDGIATSPCYGNRMSDLYDGRDGSRRHTYRIALGRVPNEKSAAGMQWGEEYRKLHIAAWLEARRVLKPGGLMVVNISNHIRKGRVIGVVEWHLQMLLAMGFFMQSVIPVVTPRNRHGANHELRVDAEHILVLRKGL